MLRIYLINHMEHFKPVDDFIDYLFTTIADGAIEQMLQDATSEENKEEEN